MKKLDRREVLNNSIIIIGPDGIGKQFVCQALAKKYGLPYVRAEHLCDAGDYRTIKKEYNRALDRSARCAERAGKALFFQERFQFEQCAKEEHSRAMHIREYMVAREMLPNVKTFRKMGYSESYAKRLNNEYADNAVYRTYMEQFYNELYASIFEELKAPCVISVDADWIVSGATPGAVRVLNSLDNNNNSDFFDADMISNAYTDSALAGYRNVIGLVSTGRVFDDREYSNPETYAGARIRELTSLVVDAKGLIKQSNCDRKVLSELIQKISAFVGEVVSEGQSE